MARPTTSSSTATRTSSRTSGLTRAAAACRARPRWPRRRRCTRSTCASSARGSAAASACARRVPVAVILARAGAPVAIAQGESRADGSWGPLTLRGRDGQPHAVGDDRDVIEVLYGVGPHGPAPDVIETGDGGNPFTESGFTGWFDLDHGYAVSSAGARTHLCDRAVRADRRAHAAHRHLPGAVAHRPVRDRDRLRAHHRAATSASAPRVTLTSEDNRAPSALEPDGGLVRMTIALGEPRSVSAVANGQLLHRPHRVPDLHRVPADPLCPLLGAGPARVLPPAARRPRARLRAGRPRGRGDHQRALAARRRRRHASSTRRGGG